MGYSGDQTCTVTGSDKLHTGAAELQATQQCVEIILTEDNKSFMTNDSTQTCVCYSNRYIHIHHVFQGTQLMHIGLFLLILQHFSEDTTSIS